MNWTEKNLLEKKEKLNRLKESLQEKKGELKALKNRLKDEFNCPDLKAAEKKLKKMDSDIEGVNEEIEKKVTELNTLLYDDDD